MKYRTIKISLSIRTFSSQTNTKLSIKEEQRFDSTLSTIELLLRVSMNESQSREFSEMSIGIFLFK
jgi:hypothetical protein